MRNLKLAATRFIVVIALGLGYYLYHRHSKKNIVVYPPCLPGYVIHDDVINHLETCEKA